MPDKYIISKARTADAAEILNLQYAAYQSEAMLYNNFSIQPLTQTLAQALAEFQNSLVLKAVSDGKIIGSVRGRKAGDTVYIAKLMVLPGYQNQGLGQQLLQSIEHAFPGHRFELFTGAKSSKNIALYEKCGYTRFKVKETASEPNFIYLEKF